jgi:adsorption protein B
MRLDHWVAALLVPLAVWVLLNGVDDFFIDCAALVGYLRMKIPTEAQLDAAPVLRMAIFVAAWHEHRVIRRMIENNTSRLKYAEFEFFVGVYPNDGPTQTAGPSGCLSA